MKRRNEKNRGAESVGMVEYLGKKVSEENLGEENAEGW